MVKCLKCKLESVCPNKSARGIDTSRTPNDSDKDERREISLVAEPCKSEEGHR